MDRGATNLSRILLRLPLLISFHLCRYRYPLRAMGRQPLPSSNVYHRLRHRLVADRRRFAWSLWTIFNRCTGTVSVRFIHFPYPLLFASQLVQGVGEGLPEFTLFCVICHLIILASAIIYFIICAICVCTCCRKYRVANWKKKRIEEEGGDPDTAMEE